MTNLYNRYMNIYTKLLTHSYNMQLFANLKRKGIDMTIKMTNAFFLIIYSTLVISYEFIFFKYDKSIL